MADFDIDIGEIAEEDPYTVQGGMRNYVADEGMATVPRNWKSRPGQPETQLAYITNKEATLLREANVHNKADPGKMGTVNVGPDGVPSYDDSGMASEELYGIDESAYESASQAALDLLNQDSQNVMSVVDAQALTERARQRNLAAAAATRDPTVTFEDSPFSGQLDYDEYRTVRDPTRRARNVMGIVEAEEAAQREREYIQQYINRVALGRAGGQSSLTEGDEATEEDPTRRLYESKGVEGRGPIDRFMGWAYKDWIPKGGQVKERTTGHSSDYGITSLHGGDEKYRDTDVKSIVGSALMMSPAGVIRGLAKNQYLADPSRERAKAMAGRDSWNPYGPSWLYGQPKPKAKDYGGGDQFIPLLKKPIPIGGGPSGVATPQGIVSGDTIFGPKEFTRFLSREEASRAGEGGAHLYFKPAVAQRGGLINAAEIQRFQEQGLIEKARARTPGPQTNNPRENWGGKVFQSLGNVFSSEADQKYGEPFERSFFERQTPETPEDKSFREWSKTAKLGADFVALPFQLGKGLLNLPGAIGSGLSRLFTSDPQLANVPVINTGDPILGSGDATADRLPPEVQRMQNVVNQLSVDLADRGHWDPTNFANTGIGGSPEEGFFATVDGGAIDIEGAFDRGGAIRSSDLAGDYGTMNRMINDPRGIASLGRGGDTMLVHMRPDEVAAMSRDGRTTVNPRTGLPERFWGPALGGLAGSFFGPWGVGIGSGLGQFAQQKMMGRSTGDALQQGLYTGALAGLGSYGLGKYAEAGGGDPNWIQSMLSPEAVRTKTAGGAFTYAPGAMDPAKFGLPGKMVYPLTAGLAGMGGSMLGEMAAPPLAPPKEEPIEQPQAIARAKRSRYVRGDPGTYGSGAEQYLFDRNKGIFDYTFAQEGGLMEAAEEEEVVETSPDGVEMAYLQEDEEVMTPPGIPGMEEGMDIIVKEAVRAIRGQHPEPERAIAEYIEIYGEEDFAALQEMVTQDQALEGMGEAPVEVAEASETVEEMPMMAARGGALNGPGKGRDDQIPVLASDGEYIIAADVVSGLGDGSTKAGAQTLDAMADRVRQMRTGTEKQPEILPEEMALPA